MIGGGRHIRSVDPAVDPTVGRRAQPMVAVAHILHMVAVGMAVPGAVERRRCLVAVFMAVGVAAAGVAGGQVVLAGGRGGRRLLGMRKNGGGRQQAEKRRIHHDGGGEEGFEVLKKNIFDL